MLKKWREGDDLPRSEFSKVIEGESDEACILDADPLEYAVVSWWAMKADQKLSVLILNLQISGHS